MGLSTVLGARGPSTGLSLPIFFGPDDCAVWVISLYADENMGLFNDVSCTFDFKDVCLNGADDEL